MLRYRKDNPCRHVQLPSGEKAEDETRFLTHAEFGLILEGMGERYRAFTEFLVMTGTRFGEATAVTVADVDLMSKPATMRINKAWKRGTDSEWRRHHPHPFRSGAPPTSRSARNPGPGGHSRTLCGTIWRHRRRPRMAIPRADPRPSDYNVNHDPAAPRDRTGTGASAQCSHGPTCDAAAPGHPGPADGHHRGTGCCMARGDIGKSGSQSPGRSQHAIAGTVQPDSSLSGDSYY